MAKSRKKRKPKSSQPKATPHGLAASEPSEQGTGSLLWLDQVKAFLGTLAREPIAIGLALLVLYRPWVDGLTFSHFNIYFTGWILVLATYFVVRLLIRGDKIRHPVPIALLAGYLLVSYISSRNSVDYDVSLRALILQVSYFFLFVLASNAIRTRVALGIVLGAVVTVTVVNTVWSIIHTEYVLPFVRESIRLKPSLLLTYFGDTVLSPELKNRLEMERAFGTFLFPNALGGFLALCTPFALGEAINSVQRFREALNEEKPVSGIENSSFVVLLVAALASFVMGIYVYSINTFMIGETQGEIALVSGTARTFLFYFFFPGAFGVISGYIIHLKGGMAYGAILRTLILFLAFPLQAYGLWLTFSRGAFLGLIIGGSLALFLVYATTSGAIRCKSITKIWARALLVVAVLSVYWNPIVSAIDLKDDGFVLPNTEIDYAPATKTYDVKELDASGTEVEFDHITSSRSLEFRLTYWKVSLLVARDYWLLGVGPGNLGSVYGAYQYLDAHPVKMAHNDYIQVLVETGIFGFMFFVAFWAYFLIWGGARILNEPSFYARMALLGMFTGVVAFLVHVFFDFHFENPSLASFMYLMTGLFFARAYLCKESTESVKEPVSLQPFRVSRIIALGGILILFLSNTAAARQFLYDFGRTVGTTEERFEFIGSGLKSKEKFNTVRFLLDPEVQTFFFGKVNEKGERVKPPSRLVSDFKYLVDSYNELKAVGEVRIILGGDENIPQDGEFPTRSLNENEAIPENGVAFFTKPEEARKLAYRISSPVLARLEELDALYPHGVNTSTYAYRWTHLLANTAIDPEVKLRYSKKCLDWAKKSVERSPKNPASYIQLSLALLERGKAEPSRKQLDYYRDAVEAYRTAVTFYPTDQGLSQNFAESLMRIGDAFVNTPEAALIEEGKAYKAEASEAYKRAALLVRYKYDVLKLR